MTPISINNCLTLLETLIIKIMLPSHNLSWMSKISYVAFLFVFSHGVMCYAQLERVP